MARSNQFWAPPAGSGKAWHAATGTRAICNYRLALRMWDARMAPKEPACKRCKDMLKRFTAAARECR